MRDSARPTFNPFGDVKSRAIYEFYCRGEKALVHLSANPTGRTALICVSTGDMICCHQVLAICGVPRPSFRSPPFRRDAMRSSMRPPWLGPLVATCSLFFIFVGGACRWPGSRTARQVTIAMLKTSTPKGSLGAGCNRIKLATNAAATVTPCSCGRSRPRNVASVVSDLPRRKLDVKSSIRLPLP